MPPVMKGPAAVKGAFPENGDEPAAVTLEGVRHGWNGGAGAGMTDVVDGGERNGS